MQASNNSPLPKGDLNNQELKTKGTIWKPLIAVSLLSIFSFTVGQYLPYVIAAVSGSGAIAAVPLAIFAVSAVVALISTIYLIRLAVSRADNKKEAGPDGKESGYTPSKEPQKFVCKNCTNLENKSNVPTPQLPLVTFGTQPNPSANMLQPPPPLLSSCAPPPSPPEQLSQASGAVPPPPPPPPPLPPGGLKNWNPAKNNTIGEKSPVGTTQKNTSPAKKLTLLDVRSPMDLNDIQKIKEGLKRLQPNNSIDGQQGSVKGSDAVESNQGTGKNETPEEYAARIESEQEKRRQLILKNIQTSNLKESLMKRAPYEPSHSDQDCTPDDEWEDKKNLAVAEVSVTNATVPQESQNNPLPEKVQSQQSNALGTTNLAGGDVIKSTGIRLTEEEKDSLSKKRRTIEYSDDESDSDNKLSNDKDISQNSPSGREERSESSDSGHGSDNDVKSKPTSPSHSMPKVGKPPAPLKPDDVQTGFQSSPPPEKEKPPVASKPANLQTGPQPSSPTKVNNVEPVNSEVQEPSTLSVKDRCRMFGGMTNEYEKPSMVSVY